MNEFLKSLKSDLLDRRLLPLVALVAVALVAAIAYAALAGGGGSTPTATSASVPTPPSQGLATSQSSSETAVAETTDGSSTQHSGSAHDPFTPLPAAKAKAKTASASKSASSSSSSSSSSSGGSSSSSGGTGSSGGSSPSAPSKPAKPKTVYRVAVLFGEVPAGSTAATVQLTPFENVKLSTPFPSAKQPLIVFRGVTAGGKTATFTIVGEVILHGGGNCLPSAAQCEAFDVGVGQSEQLEYLPAEGQPVVYELRIVSIVSSKATTASAARYLGEQSKAGRELLRRAGLVSIPDMHYSTDAGVLVFDGGGARYARAHSAARRHRR